MALTVQIHIANEEPILAEIESLPAHDTTLVVANNPRMRDGKDLRYAVGNVTSIIYPLSRISFIQVFPSGEEEKLIGFVRE